MPIVIGESRITRAVGLLSSAYIKVVDIAEQLICDRYFPPQELDNLAA